MAKCYQPWQITQVGVGLGLSRRPVIICVTAFVMMTLTFVLFISIPKLASAANLDSGHSEDAGHLQYAVVIDAGSSGSRVYIYVWPPHNGDPKELLKITPLTDNRGEPLVKKIEPGLSSVADNPSEASSYIQPLIEYAAERIPFDHQRLTPLYILATAGLRLLNSSQQAAILDNLRADIPKKYLFSFAGSNAEVLSGKQEGVYQWIAINYVLQRFDHNSDAPVVAVDIKSTSPESPLLIRKETVAILDMGGASLQIAAEVTSKAQLELLQEEEKVNLAEFNLGCLEHGNDHLYSVYVTTYLGLGANELLGRYEYERIKSAAQNYTYGSPGSAPRFPVRDPCKPLDYTTIVNVTLPTSVGHNQSTGISSLVPIHVRGTGHFDDCRASLRPHLKNLTGCPGWSCALSKLPVDLATVELYGFSEFWYSMEDVLRMGGKYIFNKFHEAAQEFCKTRWSTLQGRFKQKLYPVADLHRFVSQCFKSAWIATVLHDGMSLPEDHSHLRSSPNTVGNHVVHWTLGAVLYRTRFFPLGAVRENLQFANKSSYFSVVLYLNHYLFIICFFLVFGAIVLYLRGLRCLRPNLRLMSSSSSRHYLSKDLDVETGSLIQSYYR